ncbi:MAG: hypothetical protein M3Z56_06745 [Bacteroidota bacterium]|nr:hypothetical protein [Bacteroidota bacterium]
MKKLCILISMLSTLTITAQNKKTPVKFVAAITSDIEKVAKDYFNHFQNIKGEQISETNNIIEYNSKIIPQGAIESTIMKIKSLDNSYSWEALMLDTEDFNNAVAKYRQLYRQLNGARLYLDDDKSYKLKGVYDAPDEARGFASSLLGVEVHEKALQQFKIEIALNYTMPEWSVKIYVYEKEDDEDIRPTVNN